MPETVLSVSVQAGAKNLPWTPLKKGGFFFLKEWCAEQGIEDYSYVEAINVTRFDDGSLVAYLTRRELRGEGDAKSRVRVRPGDPAISRTYIEHHPVTSIQLLLDQFEPVKESEEVSA